MSDGPRWSHVIAAILGATFALWLLQGDTGAVEFLASATVIEENTAPTGNIRCYQVRFADGTAVTVMGSAVVPLIRFLGSVERITVEARTREPQRIDR